MSKRESVGLTECFVSFYSEYLDFSPLVEQNKMFEVVILDAVKFFIVQMVNRFN